jgi:hypothetical protein
LKHFISDSEKTNTENNTDVHVSQTTSETTILQYFPTVTNISITTQSNVGAYPHLIELGWTTLSPIATSGELATKVWRQSQDFCNFSDKRNAKFRAKFSIFFN